MARLAIVRSGDEVPSYDGLFPPESVTWQVHGDPILWVAGLRALFLQATHPVAMAGVLRHSDFRADPWGRLIRTAEYVGVVSFGAHAEVEAVGQRVRRLHATVSGADPETGVTYRASDPELLRWVHCCEVESFLTTYRRAGGRLSDDEVDCYYDEQRRAAAVVGLDPQDVPGSAATMSDYFAGMRRHLAVDRRTRRTATMILLPPMPSRVQLLTPARPAWATGAGVAFGLLPRWARQLYGMGGPPGTDVAATAGVRALRSALQAAPERYREGPHLRAARRRVAAAATAQSSGSRSTPGGSKPIT
jgi:uncharacterized protein (DUF2236 family)